MQIVICVYSLWPKNQLGGTLSAGCSPRDAVILSALLTLRVGGCASALRRAPQSCYSRVDQQRVLSLLVRRE